MEITINKSKGISEEVTTYLKGINRFTSEIEKILFSVRDDSIAASSNVILAIKGDTPIGILVYRLAQLNKKDYINILVFHIDEKAAGDSLLSEVKSIYETSSAKFIMTPFLSNGDKLSQDAFVDFKYSKYEDVYTIRSSSLTGKLPNSSAINNIRFTSRNKSSYSRAFSDLLMEYDSELFANRNTAAKEPIYQTNLKGSRTQAIKVSYFVDSVAKSSNWYAYLFFLEDDDDKQPIGFIKGKVDTKHKFCFIEIYFKPKYFSKYLEASMGQFLKEVPIDYAAIVVTKNDKSLYSTLDRWCNKPTGSSYFFS